MFPANTRFCKYSPLLLSLILLYLMISGITSPSPAGAFDVAGSPPNPGLLPASAAQETTLGNENSPGNIPLNKKETQKPIPQTRLDPVVITARDIPELTSQTPGGTGVITAEEIDRHPPVSLANITRQIPGVEKTTDSPWGSEINIRGLSRNSVLFLVDGCRVNTATDINARFGLVNPYDVERIEVLKGPISALYGWGAMGGVVNVITRKGGYADIAKTREQIWVRASSNPEGYGVFGRMVFESPDLWILGAAGYRDYNETESADNTTIHNSQFRDVYARFGSGYLWNPVNETEVNIQVMEGKNIGIPGTGLASLAETTDVTYPSTKRILGSLTHTVTPESGVLDSSRVRLFYQEVDRNVRIDNFPAAAPLEAAEPGADHKTMGLNWTSHLTLGSHTPVLGIEVWEWKIDDTERTKYFKSGLVGVDSSLGNLTQTVGGIFAEDTWGLNEALKLNIGGRLDATQVKSDDLYNWITPPSSATTATKVRDGETTTDESWQAQTGLTWQMAKAWSITGIAAASYRPPDLMDLFKYVSLGSGVSLYGNPDLKPERSYFFESGLHYVDNRIRLSGCAYLNTLKDMITENQVSATRIEMANVDKARIYGAEISGQWRFAPQFLAQASFAWTRGKNRTTGEPLPFIAPLNAQASLGWDQADQKKDARGWHAKIIYEWADAQDKVPEGQEESDCWQTVDVTAGYRFKAFGKDQDLSLAVTNIFDEDYHNYLATSRGMELKEPGVGVSLQYRIQL